MRICFLLIISHFIGLLTEQSMFLFSIDSMWMRLRLFFYNRVIDCACFGDKQGCSFPVCTNTFIISFARIEFNRLHGFGIFLLGQNLF
jgi:hypothetical protein